MDINRIYGLLGKPGRFHVIVYILLCLNYFPVVINHLVMAIYGAKTPHSCKADYGNTSQPSYTHIQSNSQSPDPCYVYVNFTSDPNRTEYCSQGWEYTKEKKETNIITEFDLVCDRHYLSKLATTIYFLGVMLGGPIFGALSDRFGRKLSILISLYGNILLGTGLAFVPTYIAFVSVRFLQGILMQGLQACTYVLIMELFTGDDRTLAGTGFELFWGTGVCWLAFIGYLLQNWRHIQLALTLPSLLAIFYIWVIPESPRWLVVNERYKQAGTVLKKIAQFNNISIPEEALVVKEGQESSVTSDTNESLEKKGNILDMFRTPSLRARTLIMFYIWFVCAFTYFGLSLKVTSLAGNKYLNLFIAGCIEIVVYALAMFVIFKFGRKKPLCAFLLIGGVCCIAAGCIPTKPNIVFVSTGLALVGRAGLGGCFSVLLLYTCELYPTMIRNVSLGACTFCTRLGAVLAPQMLLLQKFTFSSFPILVFGALAVVASLLCLLLPETFKKPFPDTIEEAENLGRTIPNNEDNESSVIRAPDACTEQPLMGSKPHSETFI